MGKQEEVDRKIIISKWALGFRDRGLGHGDFAVVTTDGTLIAECPSRSVAEYLIRLHNEATE